jgi:hypothetical protein
MGTADGDGPPQAATRIATIAAITTTGASELERMPGARFGRLGRSIIQRYAAASHPDAATAVVELAGGLRLGPMAHNQAGWAR